jgi:hypothetical protein
MDADPGSGFVTQQPDGTEEEESGRNHESDASSRDTGLFCLSGHVSSFLVPLSLALSLLLSLSLVSQSHKDSALVNLPNIRVFCRNNPDLNPSSVTVCRLLLPRELN